MAPKTDVSRASAPTGNPSIQQKTKGGEIVDNEDMNIGGGFNSFEEIVDALPRFLHGD
jgi:hypothetical protein